MILKCSNGTVVNMEHCVYINLMENLDRNAYIVALHMIDGSRVWASEEMPLKEAQELKDDIFDHWTKGVAPRYWAPRKVPARIPEGGD